MGRFQVTINNRKYLHGIIAVLVLVIVVAMGAMSPVALATTISPVRLELNSDPGEQVRTQVKITNTDDVTRKYYISAARFETQGENGNPLIVPGDRSGLVSWLNFPTEVEIAARESKEIPVEINVPMSASPGGYFVALLASIAPPANDGRSDVSLQSDTGTLLLFTVNGDYPKQDLIVEFGTKDDQSLFAHVPIQFFFRFQNSGGDRAQPLGDITIRNIFGQVTKIVPANRSAGNVLPKSIRKFESAWVTTGDSGMEQFDDEVKEPHLPTFWSHVRYEWNNFAFGRYTADLKVTVNNDSSRSHSRTVSFWIIPWHLIMTVFAIIAAERLLGGLWRRARRKRRERREKQ